MIFDSAIRFGDAAALTSFFGDHAIAHATYGPLLQAKFSRTRSTTFDVSDQGALRAWLLMNVELAETQQAKVPDALANWLQFHNAMHQSEAEVMGLTGLVDLSAVDFRNPGEFYDWMQTHQDAHSLENTILGI